MTGNMSSSLSRVVVVDGASALLNAQPVSMTNTTKVISKHRKQRKFEPMLKGVAGLEECSENQEKHLR